MSHQPGTRATTRRDGRHRAGPNCESYITENGCADNTGPGADGQVHDASRVDYMAGQDLVAAGAIDYDDALA